MSFFQRLDCQTTNMAAAVRELQFCVPHWSSRWETPTGTLHSTPLPYELDHDDISSVLSDVLLKYAR